jgi:hypothetical protein
MQSYMSANQLAFYVYIVQLIMTAVTHIIYTTLLMLHKARCHSYGTGDAADS